MIPRSAFTLIELLVVVTIIVVLLALLAPALDKAIYQAELAVCGAHWSGVGRGVVAYTFDNKRYYPVRGALLPQTNPQDLASQPTILRVASRFDDRPTYRPYFPIALLVDPLCQKLDLNVNQPDTGVIGTGNLWFGWKFAGNRGMNRLGQKLQWKDHDLSVLGSDNDTVSGLGGAVQGSHPESKDNKLVNVVYADTASDPGDPTGNAILTQRRSFWTRNNGPRSNYVDYNHLFDDGSVRRYDDSEMLYDDRMVGVPLFSNLNNAGWQVFVPKQ